MEKEKIKIPIINLWMTIITYKDARELITNFPELNLDGEDLKYVNAGVFERDHDLYIAFQLDSGITHGVISHECKHLVNNAFGLIGQRLDMYNDELECYFLKWVVDQVYSFIDFKPK